MGSAVTNRTASGRERRA